MARERIGTLEPPADTRPPDALPMRFKVDTDDNHSWPPANSETLWVMPEPQARTYRILSIPVLANGIAIDDTVFGEVEPNGDLTFDRKYISGGHSTIRIFIDHQADENTLTERITAIVSEIEDAGCTVRRTRWDLILAVDIPTLDAYEHVYDDCLIPRGEAGDLSVESACMTFDT